MTSVRESPSAESLQALAARSLLQLISVCEAEIDALRGVADPDAKAKIATLTKHRDSAITALTDSAPDRPSPKWRFDDGLVST